MTKRGNRTVSYTLFKVSKFHWKYHPFKSYLLYFYMGPLTLFTFLFVCFLVVLLQSTLKINLLKLEFLLLKFPAWIAYLFLFLLPWTLESENKIIVPLFSHLFWNILLLETFYCWKLFTWGIHNVSRIMYEWDECCIHVLTWDDTVRKNQTLWKTA